MNTNKKSAAALIALAALFVASLLGACGSRVQAEGAASAGAKAAAAGPGPSNKKVTFVELGSVNCVPCKAMQPLMDEIKTRYPDQVEVVFHDVWTAEGRPFAAKFGVRVIPTQVFLDAEGKEYFRHEGFLPMDQLREALARGGAEL